MDTIKNLIQKIPKEVSHVTSTLEGAGFEAYLVGDVFEDLLMEREPKDWDIATNAKPEQIIGLFEKTVYEMSLEQWPWVPACAGRCYSWNIKRGCSRDLPAEAGTFRQIEVTPYRIEAKYSDFRHPDKVKFSDNLTDDLKRRDFTVNAMALNSKDN